MRFRRDVTPSHSNRASGEMAVRGRPMRRCRRADAISVKSSPEVIEPFEKQVSFISGLETEMETLRNSTAEISSSAPSRNDMAKESVYFLGLDFDGGSIEEAASNILAEAHERFRYIVTPNVHHMVRMLEDPVTLRPLYERAWRVFCDSRVLSRLARVGGLSLPVITGSDLTADLIARAAKHGLMIAVIGPTDAACARLQDKYPGLRIVSHNPKMGFIRSELEIRKCVDFVVKAGAPLVFLAVGRPQQEILASRIADHPQARGVGLCIGAAIDFLTGAQHRAPVWVQKVGLEWFYRLVSDPQRFARRYLLESPRIFYFVCLEWQKNTPSLQLGARMRHWWLARRQIPRHGAGAETNLAPAGNVKPSKFP